LNKQLAVEARVVVVQQEEHLIIFVSGIEVDTFEARNMPDVDGSGDPDSNFAWGASPDALDEAFRYTGTPADCPLRAIARTALYKEAVLIRPSMSRKASARASTKAVVDTQNVLSGLASEYPYMSCDGQ
jgi:hypothetical protein